MKYPASRLTPFLAALPSKARISFHYRSLISHQGTRLSAYVSIACSLLNSLASLFATPSLYFQSFADSFVKTPGGGGGTLHLFLVYPDRFSRGAAPLLPRICFQELTNPSPHLPPHPSLTRAPGGRFSWASPIQQSAQQSLSKLSAAPASGSRPNSNSNSPR